jgi:hypothetical protein
MARLRVHTVDQPDCDITAFVLSCNRLELLDQTLASFLATRDLLTKVVIVDDSGQPEIFDTLVAKYGHYADVVCFPENRGLWWAKDFMVSFCSTKYIFYVEDDWLFLGTGYLSQSKAILESRRDVGTVDISWRTFEDEGFDSYEPELIDNLFYWKKPWRISASHHHWFIWHGSPNLKRREDLLLLGRVEKDFHEWNIDRKFYALGFRGVFLAGCYVRHLGDHCSVMQSKRANELTTPEMLYPPELQGNRTFPVFDYWQMDQLAETVRGDSPPLRSCKKAIVTCLVDIDREQVDNRQFDRHYLQGFKKLVELDVPIIAYVDRRYSDAVFHMAGGKPIKVIPYTPQFASLPYYRKLVEICQSEDWINQSAWMRNSVIGCPDYIALTLNKIRLVTDCVASNWFNAEEYYWLDSGICNSFAIPTLKAYDLSKLDGTKFFMSTFPYTPIAEVHGYAKAGYQQLCGQIPSKVCRATLFGGNKDSLNAVAAEFRTFLYRSLEAGYIGTEEAIFTGLALLKPELFHLVDMPSGDIKHYLEFLRR